MITEDYVSYETAKLLDEKGFVVPYDSLRGAYINGGFLRRNPGQGYLHNTGDEIIEACSLQMAMKWLREVHKLHIEIDSMLDKGGNEWYNFYAFRVDLVIPPYDNLAEDEATEHKTYEEACDSAIKYCLENLI